jgi:hypothetical protein
VKTAFENVLSGREATPPLSQNQPRHAGSALWARSLRERMNRDYQALREAAGFLTGRWAVRCSALLCCALLCAVGLWWRCANVFCAVLCCAVLCCAVLQCHVVVCSGQCR